jgi:Cu+-exporting ATPase
VTVELTGDAVAGATSDFALRFTDANGDPVTGIRPYLGAAGHVVILRTDGTRFAHAHAETTKNGRPVFATPGTTFGPDLDLHTTLPIAGTYQLWGQFRLPDGEVITTPFTVHTTAHQDSGHGTEPTEH